MTEPEAREKHGDGKVKIYTTSVGPKHTVHPALTIRQFKGMSGAMLDEERKPPTSYKLVCVGPEEKVVGLHIIGEGSDEMLQGCEFALSPISMGLIPSKSRWRSRWARRRLTLTRRSRFVSPNRRSGE
jgi:pyruvate/2-oxoglutarate dehydrogenase complex dihydrolipoamide dehydrogenase (E3) component